MGYTWIFYSQLTGTQASALVSDIVVDKNKIIVWECLISGSPSLHLRYTTQTHMFAFLDQCRRNFPSIACLFASGEYFLNS